MKKTGKNLFVMLFLIMVSFQVKAQPSGGSGTSADPYRIATLADLKWVADQVNTEVTTFSGKYIMQTANIDASETSTWNSNGSGGYYGWMPIGANSDWSKIFSGTYNGNGHNITNLYINRTYTIQQDFTGLFGICQNATIENVCMINVTSNGYYNCGGLIGIAYQSTIKNCSTSGSITGQAFSGGLIGSDVEDAISGCYSECSVSIGNNSSGAIGGLIGGSESASISNCYATGTVSVAHVNDASGGSGIGGFIGQLMKGSGNSLSNCYSIGLVTLSDASTIHLGGFIGRLYNSPTANNCFWNTETSGQSTSPAGTGKNTAQMQTATPYTDAWSTTNWNFVGGSYPKLLWNTTFTGPGNWSDPSKWDNGSPGLNVDVTIIGSCTVDGSFSTDNLTLNTSATLTIAPDKSLAAGGNLTLKSDATGTASLINNGTLTITGTTNAERYMTGGKWHIISPTAAGGSISTFIQATGNDIPVKTSNYGMMDYNETTNTWKSYFTSGTGGNLIAGTGYSVRRNNDGAVTFTGTPASGTKTVSLTKGGEGWNCVGNPYPSAINMNTAAGTNNFLKTNASDATNIDPSYCVYVWDDDTKTYKVLNNVPGNPRDPGINVFAPGQGFFVKANGVGSSIEFNQAMQVHNTSAVLKSVNIPWASVALKATSASTSSTALIYFHEGMTPGLDVTYDAGLLRGSNGLSLYTKLVDDNGVDFAIQCLPENNSKNMVISVGLDCVTGGEVTFSAETVELPAACSVILEDKTTKTFTSLADGATYKATVPSGATGTGRFYIHTNDVISGVSDLPSAATFSLKVYPANGEIIIEGAVSNQAKAALFDLNGKKLGGYTLQGQNRNTISVAGVVPGVYLLNVTDSGKRFNTKTAIY